MQNADDFQIRPQLCSHRVFWADVTATVTINGSSRAVDFESEEFDRKKESLDPTVFDFSRLQQSFFSPNWTTKLTSRQYSGPLMAIAASAEFNYEPTKLLSATNLVHHAAALYQQFFGEMMLMALESDLVRNTEKTSGQRFILQRRILANLGIGITLAVLLLASACGIVVIALSTRLHRRTLGLLQDPGSIAATSALIVAYPRSRNAFQGAEHFSEDAIRQHMGNRIALIKHGDVLVGEDHAQAPPRGKCFSAMSSPLLNHTRNPPIRQIARIDRRGC